MLRLGGKSVQPQAAPLARVPAHEAKEALALPVQDHPAWSRDERIPGTIPESAQVGTVRQLFRVIGRELAKTTATTEQAIEKAAAACKLAASVRDPARQLYAAVDTMERAHEGYDHATDLLERHFSSACQGATSLEKVTHLMALSRVAFEKMMDTQLSKPREGNIRSNGDGSMQTVFGARGEVQGLSIRLMRGKLSAYLIENLQLAHHHYEQQKRELQKGAAIRDDSVFDVTIKVGGARSFTFKTTETALKGAYLEALVQYASIGYADRMRGRE